MEVYDPAVAEWERDMMNERFFITLVVVGDELCAVVGIAITDREAEESPYEWELVTTLEEKRLSCSIVAVIS